MASKVYLLLGSNQGNRLEYLINARQAISRQMGAVITASAVFESAPWGNTAQPPFLNQVVLCQSKLLPIEALQEIHSIETRMGRIRTEKWGPRTLDIDILFWDNLVLNSPQLTIPHPGVPLRRFTLLPLLEIAPELRHPQSGKTIQELLEACPDELPVIPYIPS